MKKRILLILLLIVTMTLSLTSCDAIIDNAKKKLPAILEMLEGTKEDRQCLRGMHNYSEWEIKTPADNCEDRVYSRFCINCNAKDTTQGSHEYKLCSDETHHWYKCSGCESYHTKKWHNFSNSTCSSCDYHANATEGIVYNISDNGKYATVTGYAGEDTDIVIAETYNGVPVTKIGESAFYECNRITSVVIPDSVTSIGASAFNSCIKLTNVTIGNGVSSIGWGAFNSCTNLNSVVLGDSVSSIGKHAFYLCYKLVEVINHSHFLDSEENLRFDASNSYIGLYAQDIHEEKNSRIENIDGYLFYTPRYGSNIYLVGYIGNDTDLVLPEDYKGNKYEIYEYAFSDCNNINSVIIPENITDIRKNAFRNCTSLTNVMIPDSVTDIDEKAFRGCSSLTSITIPDSVTSIGDEAFGGCDNLTSVVIGDSVTSIGDGAFYNCSSLTSIEVNENNQNFKSIDGNLYTKDGKSLIQYAIGKKDTSFIIPDNVTSIDSCAFMYCSSLTSVVIPDSVTSIGYDAFKYCSSLTSVVIGNSVTSIGSSAFYNCSSLTSVYITDLTSWCNIEFGDYYANPLYYTSNLVLNNQLVTRLVIPNNVTSIGDYAFYDCDSLTSVVIPDSVTSIGKMAFYDCDSLTSVVIGDSVTSIGDYAFDGCSRLTSVVIGDSVTTIGEYAFDGCSSLTSVVIGDSVTSIGYAAFYGCYSLTDVYYTGTEEEWANIIIYDYNSNHYLKNATIHYNYVPEE